MLYYKIQFVNGEKIEIIDLEKMNLKASVRKNYKRDSPYSNIVPKPLIMDNKIVFDDMMFLLFKFVFYNIFKYQRKNLILPYGVYITEKKQSKKIKKVKKHLDENYTFVGEIFKGKYKRMKIGNWAKAYIDSVFWKKFNPDFNGYPNSKIKNFELMAFDFETHPGPGERSSQPVMVCLTRINVFSNAISNVAHFLGSNCNKKLIIWLRDYLLSCNLFTVIFIVGFNSSRFDNIFIAAALNELKNDQRFKIEYLQASGRIIDITLKCLTNFSKISFRDVLMYYPVGSRGSLKQMALNFKLDEIKDECSLDEMRIVADLIIDFEKENTDCDFDNNQWPEVFYKELNYCYQDTRVVYGLIRHIGKVLSSLDGPKKTFFEGNLDLIPVDISFITQFLTLPQTAFKFLAEIFEEDFTSEFSFISKAEIAIFCQRSIYGGRTLCGSITQPIYGVVSTDICSEYPSAMCGPMPSGFCYFMSINMINKLNEILNGKEILLPEANICKIFENPFIAYCYIFKEKPINQHYPDGNHIVSQVIPFVPNREYDNEWLTSVYPSGGKAPLKWIDDTDGNVLCGVYNCVDIFLMCRLGFKVQINTMLRPIYWEKWSFSLKEIYVNIFKMKAQAKASGDKNLELAVKIVLNSSIGKFAQRISMDSSFDGEVYSETENFTNKTMFQLNSFCMSWSRMINQCHQSLVCYGNAVPKYDWSNTAPIKSLVYYCDTDNMIFQSKNWELVDKEMTRSNLKPQLDFLAEWKENGSYFHMTLEFEEWHDCPNKPDKDMPIISNVIFLGKKSYIMFCTFCGPIFLKELLELKNDHQDWNSCKSCSKCLRIKEIRSKIFRLKAKGHSKAGIFPEDYACILFPKFPLNLNIFIPPYECFDGPACSHRMFKFMYPNKTDYEIEKMSSGKRFTFSIKLPSSGMISLIPSSIERKYRAFIPDSQKRCVICYFIIQK